MRNTLKGILDKLSPVAKAVAAAAVGAVVPLLIAGFTSGFNWQAILSAAGTAACSALAVFVVPNRQTLNLGTVRVGVQPVSPFGPTRQPVESPASLDAPHTTQ